MKVTKKIFKQILKDLDNSPKGTKRLAKLLKEIDNSKKESMKKKINKQVYVCNNCEGDMSHGAIICPHCKETDPKVRRVA